MNRYNFLGGKLIGAGGGFLMVTKNKQSISMLNKDKISYMILKLKIGIENYTWMNR